MGVWNRRPPNAVQKSSIFRAMFAIATNLFVMHVEEYFRTASLALVVH